MTSLMKDLFKKFDLNGDGLITTSELTQVYGNMFPEEGEAEIQERVKVSAPPLTNYN